MDLHIRYLDQVKTLELVEPPEPAAPVMFDATGHPRHDLNEPPPPMLPPWMLPGHPETTRMALVAAAAAVLFGLEPDITTACLGKKLGMHNRSYRIRGREDSSTADSLDGQELELETS